MTLAMPKVDTTISILMVAVDIFFAGRFMQESSGKGSTISRHTPTVFDFRRNVTYGFRVTKLRALFLMVFILAAAWLAYDQGTKPSSYGGRGMPGMEFVVPQGYEEVPVGEAGYEHVADILLARLRPGMKAAAVFTREGDRIHVLVDNDGGVLEEHILGKSGVLRKIQWEGPVRDRLEWASKHGTFAAPDMSAPVDRNAYH